MRTLTAALLTEQRAAFNTPYVKLELIPLAGTTLTYQTTDAADRIVSIVHNEAHFAAGATNYAALIRLNNRDQHFQTKTLEGYKARISYGFIVSGSPVSSPAAPLWVMSQRDQSEQGVLVTELGCMDVFQRLRYYRAMTGAVRLDGTFSGSFQHGETVTGGTSGASGKLWSIGTDHILVKAVSGTFSNGETVTGGTSGATLTSITATVGGVGDPPIWERDTNLSDIIKELLSTCELASADAGLTVDTTESLQSSQPYLPTAYNSDYHSILEALMGMTKSGLRMRDGSYARPGMRMLAVTGTPQSQLVGTISGNFTPGELVTQAVSGATGRVVYQDGTTALHLEANTGTFNTTNQATGGSSGATITPTSINPQDYEYALSGDHSFWSNIRDRHLVLPNRIYFTDKFPDPVYSGAAVNQASIDAFGTVSVTWVADDPDEIQSNQDAQDKADAMMFQLEQEKNTGALMVPMNVGTEVWDMVEITDTRSDQAAFTDRVQGLTRVYRSSQVGVGQREYVTELRFGSLMSRYKTTYETMGQGGGAQAANQRYKSLMAELMALQAKLDELNEMLDKKRQIPTGREMAGALARFAEEYPDVQTVQVDYGVGMRFTVLLSTTRQAAEISNMTHVDWLGLYGWGIMPTGGIPSKATGGVGGAAAGGVGGAAAGGGDAPPTGGWAGDSDSWPRGSNPEEEEGALI